jgi:hypothetical protein
VVQDSFWCPCENSMREWDVGAGTDQAVKFIGEFLRPPLNSSSISGLACHFAPLLSQFSDHRRIGVPIRECKCLSSSWPARSWFCCRSERRYEASWLKASLSHRAIFRRP